MNENSEPPYETEASRSTDALMFWLAMALVAFIAIAYFSGNMIWVAHGFAPIVIFIGIFCLRDLYRDVQRGFVKPFKTYMRQRAPKIRREDRPILYHTTLAFILLSPTVLIGLGGALLLGYIEIPQEALDDIKGIASPLSK